MREVALAIVGGGPAGIATALFLSHAAPSLTERLLVLEKESYPREKFCAGGVGGRADRLLSSIGLTVDVPSVKVQGVAFKAMGRTTVVRAGEIGRVVRRIEYDAELARLARQRGITVLENAKVGAIRRRDGGYSLETSQGEVRCDVLVGADGVGSVVRRSLGFVSTRYRAQALEIDTEMVDEDLPRDVLLFDASHRRLPGYYWDFPTLVGGREMVCRGVYMLSSGETTPAVQIQDLLAEELAARGLDLTKFRKKRFAERGFEAHRPIAQPHVLLVGEAAGIDPVTGEGIAQALFYGATAGRYLAERIVNRDLGFDDWPTVVTNSHVGRDLRVREQGVRLFYGDARPNVERFLHASPEFIRLGLQHFAGKRWSKLALARAGAAAVGHTALWGVGRLFGRDAAREFD
ncbi:MAG: NAD(P)/FAD-dependent oxidoreductase [Polyangiaceae bacterium]